MSGIRIPKQTKKRRSEQPGDAQEQTMQLLRAHAGAAHRENMDPVYALSESYAQVFDFVGRQRVQQEAGGEPVNLRGTDMQDRIRNGESEYLRRFSEYAFRNGRLAGAILQGRGQLVLNTCLKKSAGNPGFHGEEVHRRVDSAFFINRRIGQSGGDAVNFYTDADSALSFVVDASRTASQALRSLLGSVKTLEDYEVSSLKEIFPFLFDEEDRRLERQLEARRRQLEESGDRDGTQYRAVTASLDKTRVVLSKKAQMKARFVSELEKMLANAKAAEEIFQSDDYRKAVREMLMQAEYAEGAKPDENGGNDPAGAGETAD